MKVIAVADRYGAVHHPAGIDIRATLANTARDPRRSIVGYPEADAIDPDEMLALPCTVLIPAAMERVITAENAGQLRCRILAEGANGPTTLEADAILAESDIQFRSSRTCCATPAG